MLNMARVGVDGVNIATFPGASFQVPPASAAMLTLPPG